MTEVHTPHTRESDAEIYKARWERALVNSDKDRWEVVQLVMALIRIRDTAFSPRDDDAIWMDNQTTLGAFIDSAISTHIPLTPSAQAADNYVGDIGDFRISAPITPSDEMVAAAQGAYDTGFEFGISDDDMRRAIQAALNLMGGDK